MLIRFKGSIPKDYEFKHDNEDVFKCSLVNNLIVLSDGASESFNAKLWAKLLVKRINQNTQFNLKWISSAIKAYEKSVDPLELSWAKRAAFERGSFASLLCAHSNTDKKTVDILSIGDSLAVLLEDYSFKDSFPYTNSTEFFQAPKLVSTKLQENEIYFSPGVQTQICKSWELTKKNTVLLMTDALAAWGMKKQEEGRPQWEKLANIRRLTELKHLVEDQRAIKEMRVDDTTLIVICF